MSTVTNEWTLICQVTDIPVLGSRRVARDKGMDVAVFRNGNEEVFALLDRCPHKGGPLSQGIVFGTHVACPLHNWSIGLCDGQASSPDEGCTPKFSVKLDGGAVYLKASELQGHATDLLRPVAGPARRSASV
jgi:nitrite reductase (NADH) small subunit